MTPPNAIAKCRAFLDAAASRIQGAAFKFARGHRGELLFDADTLWVNGVCVARRLGPNIVVEVYGLGMSDTLYPSAGVAALVAAVERHMMAKAKEDEVRHAAQR